ncbi:hypothetical protein Scep_024583 [Stephania cephalantha]|uniref:Uncharacterized protein n=1 Tax=Stephania cephalantha TaxID=152367 RepID=A0AAP0F422_9MAGN
MELEAPLQNSGLVINPEAMGTTKPVLVDLGAQEEELLLLLEPHGKCYLYNGGSGYATSGSDDKGSWSRKGCNITSHS